MKKIIGIFFLLSVVNTINGQEIKKDHSSSWNSIMTKMELSEHWQLVCEFHFRRTNFLQDWEQVIARPSVHYKPNTTYDFSIGYSYIKNFAFSEFSNPINTNEHNLWQQVALNHSSGKIKFNHRFRFEERFVDNIIEPSIASYIIDGTSYKNRFRYRFTLKRPIIKVKENTFISVKIFDEIFINQDKGICPKSFNQNWFYVGLDYPLNKHFTLGIGYHNIGLKGIGNTFITNTILQTTVGYTIN